MRNSITVSIIVASGLLTVGSAAQDVRSVMDKPLVLTADALGAAFSTSVRGGVRVGDETFPLRLSVPAFYRHALKDIQASIRKALPALTGDDLARLTTLVVAEVRRGADGKVDFATIAGRLLDDSGAEIQGVTESTLQFNSAISGRPGLFERGPGIRVLYGFFVFGTDSGPWVLGGTAGDTCTIEIKNAVFATEAQLLFANTSTAIRSAACWCPLGDIEFKGEAQILSDGVKLLQGAQYRKRTGSGL